LYAIQQFFGVGIVNERPIAGLCVYRVTKLEDLINIIIPHFMLYSLCTCKQADFMLYYLCTCKQADFILWQIVINMMANGLHLTADGFNTILTYYASINKGMSQTLLAYFPNIVPVLRPAVILPTVLNPF
jgi:hypothetical protein